MWKTSCSVNNLKLVVILIAFEVNFKLEFHYQ